MRKWVLAAVAALAVGQVEAATTSPRELHYVRFWDAPGDHIIGSFAFRPDAVDAAKAAGESTATIFRSDLVWFHIIDAPTHVEFSLDDVLDSFTMDFQISGPSGAVHATPAGPTSVIAVSGAYKFSFLDGYKTILMDGPNGGVRDGIYSVHTAYVPLPASAPLLGGAIILLAGYRRRSRLRDGHNDETVTCVARYCDRPA